MMLRTVSVALILAAGAGVAHADADIYRWKDAQGIYHYSDQWVPGSELIKSASKPKAADSSGSRSSTASNVSNASNDAPPDGVTPATAQSVKDDVAKAHDQQCKQAKDAYDKAIHARRIYKSEKEGEKEYMSDAEADAYRLKIRGQMDEYCGTSSRSQ
jgi:hypothetical protein